ncbi:succinate dehydrogenase assembly factor 2 family protein [Fulvimarina endophytica]|uniref:FAD assembly factor SdhE n=1 Tax=Fulvimarina endophytica TaxID=2293836 RepID=A0A371X0Q4_9HYPH|nr:succinate dehydrogenase assembly factor 2 [Fulvimarina endophytica]RFC62813.1 succinate dehydrogenase assembly factor 2 family protein [Fulvimarina endophytica]
MKTGSRRTSADLDTRRKKALFRSWHRGTREMDLVFGRFADAEIADLDDDEMAIYEELMLAPDPEIFKWVSGAAQVPGNYDTPVFRRIKAFYTDFDIEALTSAEKGA